MDDEPLEIDVEATKRVVTRAIVSAVLAFFAVGGSLVFPRFIAMFFQAIVVIVGISAVRTLTHREAAVAGGVRWVGVVLALVAALAAGLMLVGHVLVLTGVLRAP